MNQLTKGLIVTLISLFATTLSTTGWPADLLGWEILGITMIGTVCTYLGQSLLLPGTSNTGALDWRDLLKGALVAVGTALSSLAASGITGSHVEWIALAKLVVTTVILYLAKNLVTTGKPKVT